MAGRAERLAPASGSAAPRLRIAWILKNAKGKPVGRATQISAHPVAADAKLTANIDKKADPDLSHLSDAIGYYIARRFPLVVREITAYATEGH